MMWLNTAIVCFLWCYAGVLVVAWIKAVANEPHRLHIAHFVQLMGLFVPVIAGLLGLLLLVAFTQFHALLLLLPFLLPVGVIGAFQLELSRLRPATQRGEIQRLAVASGIALGIIFFA